MNPEFLLSVLEFYDFTVTRSPRQNKDVNNSKTDNTYIKSMKEEEKSSIKFIIEGHTAGKPFPLNRYEKYMNCVNRLLSSIGAHEIDKDSVTYGIKLPNGSAITHCLTLSDKIYLRYQIEKVFAPSTIDCLYQNLIQAKNKAYALNTQTIIDTLASCLRLPNVFTRQYILQMAVDTITIAIQ